MNSMSSGWAAMAMAVGSGMELLEFNRTIFPGRKIRREHGPMRWQRGVERRQRHVLTPIHRIEKRLKLRLVGVIGNVAGIEQLHREFAPTGFVQPEPRGMKAVVQET